jgi:hypothetical protein
MDSVGAPIGVQQAGMNNTYIVPAELSWKLGQSGFYVKTGLGIYTPDGTITGPTGHGSIGNPWWTFQPEFVVSYLKDGWNLTANFFEEFNTASTITGYTGGDVFHAEFTAAKRIGKWTIGPVAYYVGQVTADKSSAFYGNVVNISRYNIWGVGGLVGYDFGPVSLNVWAIDEVHSDAQGAFPNTGVSPKGWTGYLQISYRLWAPDAPAQSPGMFHK